MAITSRVLMLLTLALLGATLSGCSSGGKMSLLEARAAKVPTHDEALGGLGYRRLWRGFPLVAPKARVEFTDVSAQYVVVEDSDNVVSVLDASSGERLWSAEVTNPLTRFVGIRQTDSRALVSSETELFVYDLETGSLLDKQTLGRVVNTQPIKYGDLLVYGTNTGGILARLTSVSVKLWENSINGAIEAPPIDVDGAFMVISQTGEILIGDPSTGSGIGRARIYGGVAGRPVAADGIIFVASLDHSVYAFGRDARPLWRYRTGAPITAQPTIHGGVLYCTIEDGLTAFDAVTGSVLWSNPSMDGDVIGMARGSLLVWDGRRLSSVDPANGDEISTVTLDGFDRLIPDGFVDPNLYAVNNTGVIAKYAPGI